MPRDETRQNGISALKDSIQLKLGREYAGLYYDTVVVIDPKQSRLALDDISYRAKGPIEEYVEFLMLACKGEIQLFDVTRLTELLGRKLGRYLDASNRRKTAVIFPGGGAQSIKELLPEELLEGMLVIDVPTQRKVDARTGAVEGVSINDITQARKVLGASKLETILVIDDVIATGSTIVALQEAFPLRNVEWCASALFSLSPLQRRRFSNGSPSGVEGFRTIITPIVYQGTSGIPALNSLSTLIGDSDKSKVVRGKYITDFVDDAEIFAESVRQLQSAVVDG